MKLTRLVFLLFTFPPFPVWAEDVEVLEALDECPKSESTCQIINAYFPRNPKTGASPNSFEPISSTPIDEDEYSGYYDVTYKVTGRLNGDEEKVHYFKTTVPQDAFGCHDLLFAATAFHDRKGHSATILTNKGPLELLNTDVRFGSDDDWMVIDDRDWSMTSLLAPSWEKWPLGFELRLLPNGSALWQTGERCLSLDNGPAFVAYDLNICRNENIFIKASEEDVKAVLSLREFGSYISKYMGSRLKRVQGTHYLVLYLNSACT